MKKVLILVVSILVLVLAVVIIYQIINKDTVILGNNKAVNKNASYYATIDINPSIELALDENDIVTDAIPLNDDAVITYEGLNLIGENLTVATDKILDETIKLGYINEVNEDNSITVTTYTDSDKDIANLTTKVKDTINGNLAKKNMNAVIYTNGVTDEIKEKALQYNIPFGKMLLVQRAMNLDSTLNESTLASSSISEIQSKIKEQATQNREELKNMYQEQKQKLDQVKSQKIVEAKAKIEAKKRELLKVTGENKTVTEEIQKSIEEKKAEVEKIQEQKNKELQQIIQQRQTKTTTQSQTQVQNKKQNGTLKND